jgi:hypothetical protein
MRLRISGTRTECDTFTSELPTRLAGLARVVEVSGFYPNRGAGVLGRVYLELRLSHDPTEGDSRC